MTVTQYDTLELFARNLKRYCHVRHYNQADLARRLNVTRSSTSRWFKGDALPTADKLDELAHIFHIQPAQLFLQDNYDVMQLEDVVKREVENKAYEELEDVSIPQYDLNSLRLAQEPPATLEYLEVPRFVKYNHPKAFAVVLRDNSMSNLLHKGTTVVVDPELDVANGDVVVAVVNEQVVIRHYSQASNTTVLYPDTDFQRPSDIVLQQTDAIILGVVYWAQVVLKV